MKHVVKFGVANNFSDTFPITNDLKEWNTLSSLPVNFALE